MYTLFIFISFFISFFLFHLNQRLADKIIVYVNNFQVLNIVVLQMSEHFCHATFRHSSVYCLILKKVCAINKIYVTINYNECSIILLKN